MNPDKSDKKIDELIGRAIGRERPTFDFDKWRAGHQKEIQTYKAQAKKPSVSAESSRIWRIIMESRITKLAAAAAIFIAVGIFIGRWSKPTPPPHSLHVTSFTSAVSMYPAANKTEDSFWRKKALAAMQPRPYQQTLTTKTSLLNTYKQYLKEKYYD